MPLLPGNHPSIISHNVKEMVANGHSHDQAVAAALHNAGMKRSKKAKLLIQKHNAKPAPQAPMMQPPQMGE